MAAQAFTSTDTYKQVATAELFSYSRWFIQKVISGSQSNEMGKRDQGRVKNSQVCMKEWVTVVGTCGSVPVEDPLGRVWPVPQQRCGQEAGVFILQLSFPIGCVLPITNPLAYLAGFACGLSELQRSQRKSWAENLRARGLGVGICQQLKVNSEVGRKHIGYISTHRTLRKE